VFGATGFESGAGAEQGRRREGEVMHGGRSAEGEVWSGECGVGVRKGKGRASAVLDYMYIRILFRIKIANWEEKASSIFGHLRRRLNDSSSTHVNGITMQ